MWRRALAILTLLLCNGVLSTRFGHEPNAYETPNLIPYDDSELTYALTSSAWPPNKWYTFKLETELINDASQCFSGDTCVKTVDRTNGLLFYRASYDFLEVGCHYLFNVFIKLIGDSQDLIQITSLAKQVYIDPSAHDDKQAFYKYFNKKYYKIEDHWLFFSMDLFVSQQDKENFKFVDFYLKVTDNVDFIVDAASLTEVSHPNWKQEANDYIEKNRKGSLKIKFRMPNDMDPNKVSVKVEQKRKHFPFGLAVNAAVIGGNDTDPYVQRYRAWVEKRANWGGFINAIKWKFMEPKQRDDTDQKYVNVDRALAWMESKNIVMRGHAIHWNKPETTPAWVAESDDIKAEIDRRTQYVVDHFKGRFQHWDVLNEYTNTRQYQEWLGREDVLEYIHGQARSIDPQVKLFMNEWGNLYWDIHFADYITAILRLKEANLIDGIGLQGHFEPQQTPVNYELVKRHLETFTSLGIPVWITELTVSHEDETVRGDVLANLMTMFYGTANVDGILMWDFSTVNNSLMLPCALANRDVTANTVAGDRYDEKLEEWSSNLTILSPCSSCNTVERVFLGTYDVTVYYDGNEVGKLTNVEVTPQYNFVVLKCDLSADKVLAIRRRLHRD